MTNSSLHIKSVDPVVASVRGSRFKAAERKVRDEIPRTNGARSCSMTS